MKKILMIAMALSALGIVMSGCSSSEPAAEEPKAGETAGAGGEKAAGE